MKRAALLLLLVGAGCATSRTGPGGTELSTEWVEVNTPHVRLWAELDPIWAVAVAHSMEELRSGVAAFWGPEFAPADRIEVVVFRDQDSLWEFAPQNVAGYVVIGGDGSLMVTSAVTSGFNVFKTIQAHELAHHLSAYVMLRQPRWLSEGLATYLEALQIDPTGTQVVFGESPSRLRSSHLIDDPVTVAQLWQWDRSVLPGEMAHRYYAKAWWLVHHLLDSRGPQFEAFRKLLGNGVPPRVAWDRTFQGLTDVALEAEATEALATRRRPTRTAPLRRTPVQPTVGPVSTAEVLAIRAELLMRAIQPRDKKEDRRKIDDGLDRALASDPGNERALLLKGQLIEDPAAELTFLRATVERRPQSGRALEALAYRLSKQGEDPRAMLDQALALAPNDPRVLNSVAWNAARFGESAKAIEAAERAVAHRPYVASYVDTLAAALGAAGRCEEAATRQRQAIDLLGHTSNEDGYQVRLHAYEQACTPEQPVRP